MKREPRVKYAAQNVQTGEFHEAGAEEMALILGTSANSIYRTASTGTKLEGIWEISKIESKTATQNLAKNIPYALLLEWDKVTQPFKELSRRKAERTN